MYKTENGCLARFVNRSQMKGGNEEGQQDWFDEVKQAMKTINVSNENVQII